MERSEELLASRVAGGRGQAPGTERACVTAAATAAHGRASGTGRRELGSLLLARVVSALKQRNLAWSVNANAAAEGYIYLFLCHAEKCGMFLWVNEKVDL